MTDIMYVTKEEGRAIFKLAVLVATIDGNLHDMEVSMLGRMALQFGVSEKMIDEIISEIANNEYDIIGNTARKIRPKFGKYVIPYLYILAGQDYNIDQNERSIMWSVANVLGASEGEVRERIGLIATDFPQFDVLVTEGCSLPKEGDPITFDQLSLIKKLFDLQDKFNL